jgi:hypothetical protein
VPRLFYRRGRKRIRADGAEKAKEGPFEAVDNNVQEGWVKLDVVFYHTSSSGFLLVVICLDLFRSDGVSPVIFLNCPDKCATLLYPSLYAISLRLSSS